MRESDSVMNVISKLDENENEAEVEPRETREFWNFDKFSDFSTMKQIS